MMHNFYFYLLKPVNPVGEHQNLQSYIESLAEAEKQVVNDHFRFMEDLGKEKKILLGGPFQDAQGLIFIIRAETMELANEILEEEPTIKANLFRIAEAHPFQVGVQS